MKLHRKPPSQSHTPQGHGLQNQHPECPLQSATATGHSEVGVDQLFEATCRKVSYSHKPPATRPLTVTCWKKALSVTGNFNLTRASIYLPSVTFPTSTSLALTGTRFLRERTNHSVEPSIAEADKFQRATMPICCTRASFSSMKRFKVAAMR